MSDDGDGEETVWVIRPAYRRKVHTDPDCRALEKARARGAEPEPKRRSHLPLHDICEYCSGEFEPSRDQGESFAKQNMSVERPEGPVDQVRDALETADVPMDTEALRYRTLMSEQQVRRALQKLRDQGHVRQVRDPDDGRKRLYLPTTGTAADRQEVRA